MICSTNKPVEMTDSVKTELNILKKTEKNGGLAWCYLLTKLGSKVIWTKGRTVVTENEEEGTLIHSSVVRHHEKNNVMKVGGTEPPREESSKHITRW